MGTVLKQLLNNALIIALPDETIEKLEQLCQDYANSINRKKVEECCYAFIQNQKNFNFITYINKKAMEKYEETISLPHIVYRVLSEYVVYLAIKDMRNAHSGIDKLLYSLTVRNIMVLRKTSYEQLLPLSIIPQMYSFVDTYYKKESHIEHQIESNLIPDIFNVESFSDMGVTLDEELFTEVQTLAKFAEKQKYQEILSNINNRNITDDFVLANYAADLLTVNPQWKFVDENPVKTLKAILPPSRKTSKMKDIKDKLANSNLYITYDTESRSSPLLGYINGNTTLSKYLADLTFTPLEYAVYMYYEFFLEELISNA